MFSPVSISFAPNNERDDVWVAVGLITGTTRPDSLDASRKVFADYFGSDVVTEDVCFFSSARAALYFALKSLHFEIGSEVLMQAFTCVAVPNSIVWASLKPVFVDVGDNYNMDPASLSKKVSARSRAVIVQHTFGIPVDMEPIRKLAKAKGLVIIHDFAHIIESEYNKSVSEGFNEISIFSFGRDKVVSSVFGGAIVTKNARLLKKLKNYEEKLNKPPHTFVLQQLLYLIIYAISMPFYGLGLGKLLLAVSGKTNIISRAVFKEEVGGSMPQFINYALSPKLASLMSRQIKKLDRFNTHRRKISQLYIKHLSLPLQDWPYLRVPIQIENKARLLRKAKGEGIHLGNWYRGPVDPPSTDLSALNYSRCQRAEELSHKTLNLPTHINTDEKSATKIVDFLQRNNYRADVD